MKEDRFQIDIPDTEAGRIHVGLSWEDIYDEKTAKSLTQGDITHAKFSTFPKFKTFLIFLIFTFLVQALCLQFFPLSWVWNGAAFALSSAIFSLILYQIIHQKGMFLHFNSKETDLKKRDKKFLNFDLDLHCFVFDKNKTMLFEINPTDEKLINPDKDVTVYHSGEETSGAGVFDDETIHIETKKLKDENYFIFAVSNDCAHDFDKINNLKIRLANSQTDQTLLESTIDSNEKDGYAFCCVYKSDSQWMCKTINRYISFDDNSWHSTIEELLSHID